MNFGEDLIKDGISRVVNGFKNSLTQSRQAAKEIVPSESCHLSPFTIPRLNAAGAGWCHPCSFGRDSVYLNTNGTHVMPYGVPTARPDAT